MEFAAIDVETANADMSSICQIGVAIYRENSLVLEWSSLLDPEDYFDEMNVSIHGISENDVRGCPTFLNVAQELHNMLEDKICVCHTHFDRVAFEQTKAKYNLQEILNLTWLDTARVARRTWEEFAWRGYGLANVCRKIGYEFKHHNALEDAKACGQILLAAMEKTGTDAEDWLKRVNRRIGTANNPTTCCAPSIKQKGDPEGIFCGETITFTGALSVPRAQAATLAAAAGFEVLPGVSKKLTTLVVGDQDVRFLAGKEKSSKHLKAEHLNTQGHHIKIIRETDFMEMLKFS